MSADKKSQAWKECDDVSWGKVGVLLRPVISTNVKGIVNVVGSLLCVCVDVDKMQ